MSRISDLKTPVSGLEFDYDLANSHFYTTIKGVCRSWKICFHYWLMLSCLAAPIVTRWLWCHRLLSSGMWTKWRLHSQLKLSSNMREFLKSVSVCAFRNCWSTEIFTAARPSPGFPESGHQKRNDQVSRKVSCGSQGSEVRMTEHSRKCAAFQWARERPKSSISQWKTWFWKQRNLEKTSQT